MSPDEWAGRLVDYRRQGRPGSEIREIAQYLEQRGPRQPRAKRQGHASIVTRDDYVLREDEPHHLVRDAAGLPKLRLVDAGDGLAIWSPLDGGALLNPKSPGLRALGLITTYARGREHYAAAYRTADLRKGRPVALRREPNNPHDQNAVALHGPSDRQPFAYVQRGRAAAVARRLDAGESLAGVCLWGPGPGLDDDTTFLAIGSTADLAVLLSVP